MAKSVLRSKFDEKSMRRKLKNLAKSYGDSQEQMIKRWGVQTCRDMAKYTQVFGNKPKVHKMAMMKDAVNVIYTYKGRAKQTGKGVRVTARNGQMIYFAGDRVLSNEAEVLRWIEQNRKGKNSRTKRLAIDQKKVCSDALLRRAVNQKYKLTAGSAKDGWLDAGDDIARGQRGRNPARISKSLMKFARKSKRQGNSITRSRFMRATGYLNNKLPYVRSKYVLKSSSKRRAVADGARKTLKWYRMAIRAENRKKK